MQNNTEEQKYLIKSSFLIPPNEDNLIKRHFNHFNDLEIPKSKNSTKKKPGLFEWMLISMSIIGLITAIALFVLFFLIDEVPSILYN